ncbi:hypothetical protein HDU76_013811 [Blyttiomyces sp. JEL0837]|nr:hypothetical protein HDU76_013811 [Blyttiomyces sp. JEL0837]
MVVVHTVSFKVKEGVPIAQGTALLPAFKTLESIPGVLKVQFGPTFTTERNQGYTHQLVVELVDKEALKVYASHPTHIDAIKNQLAPVFDLSVLIAMDFEA